MNSSLKQTYCLFCRAGQENKVMQKLKRDGFEVLSPQVMRWRPDGNCLRKTAARLMPGYVFFEAEAKPCWPDILSYPGVLRALGYADGERALRGSDLDFVAWLKRYDGMIEISQVVQIGTKIEFVSGPLKDMAGKVMKVNKNRKQVQVAIQSDAIHGEETLMRTIWCSIEYIETNADAERLRQESRE